MLVVMRKRKQMESRWSVKRVIGAGAVYLVLAALSVEGMSLAQAVVHYRSGWCLERDFHLLEDHPLGISPLYVRRDDQIIGSRNDYDLF